MKHPQFSVYVSDSKKLKTLKFIQRSLKLNRTEAVWRAVDELAKSLKQNNSFISLEELEKRVAALETASSE